MRCAVLASALLFTLLVALPASAGVLSSATLTIQVAPGSPNDFLPGASFTAITGLGSAHGSGATATWTLPAGTLPGGIVSAPVVTTVSTPVTREFWSLGPNAGASFSAGGPNLMSIPGSWALRGYGGLTILGSSFSSPLAVRLGTPNTVNAGPFSGITVNGYGTGWTTGTTSVALGSSPSAPVYTAQGFNGLVSGGGSVVLVTSYVIRSNVSDYLYFATLNLNFVPEPAAATLLLGGAGLLGGLGVRRSRR